jgi:hypothetical protein
VVRLVDDDVFETEEEFRLVLGSPKSSTAGHAALGIQNVTVIRLIDTEDREYTIYTYKCIT